MTHGIHLIWTTHGTWLPGDRRGHWSPLFNLYGNIRERGGKLNLPDTGERLESLMARCQARLAELKKGPTEDVSKNGLAATAAPSE